MLVISHRYKRAKEGHTSREEEPRDGTDRCNDEDSCYHVLLVTAVEVVVKTRDGLLVSAAGAIATAAIAIAIAHGSSFVPEQSRRNRESIREEEMYEFTTQLIQF
jgi:hypothetical protein